MIPKIIKPRYDIYSPSLQKSISFNPFDVSDEKSLITLPDNASNNELYSTICDILNKCSIEEYDFKKFPLIEVEYLFLQVRKISVGSVMEFIYTCECGGQIELKINIDDIKYDDNIAKKLKINIDTEDGKYIIECSELTVEDIISKTDDNLVLAARTIKRMYNESGDNEIELTNLDKEELFKSLPIKSATEIINFLSSCSSKLKLDVNIKCPTCGKEEVKTLSDFFI